MASSSAGGRIALQAPIIAVVVYPSAARVTRRGRCSPGLDPAEVVLPGLPLELDQESVRVTGTGPVRVLGVDVVTEARARPDVTGAVADLESRREELRARLAELADQDETERARRGFLDVAARTGAAALARRWAQSPPAATTGRSGADGPTGSRGAGGVEERHGPGAHGSADAGALLVSVGEALATQMTAVHARRRALVRDREEVEKELAALERLIKARRAPRDPDTRAVVIGLEPTGAGTGGEGSAEGAGTPPPELDDVELEVSYLVRSAGWSAGYDARLQGERVTLTWYGMISQRTGEDWPVADLRLSTARPSPGTRLPDLAPQFVDVRRPPEPLARGRSRADSVPPSAPPPAAAADALAVSAIPAVRLAAAPIEAAVASADTDGPVSTYRPRRPVPVPADGAPHRTTVAVLELDADLDHLTVPKVATEAYLRATVTNTSRHTLLAGKVSIFHEQDFVGVGRLDLTPPGADIELQLGVDDRVRVERELVRRSTSRRMVGNVRRTDVEYRLSIANHSPLRARVTVRDQVPVSRHESIVVRDVTGDPAPDERTDLGVLTWKTELEPGAEREISLAFRLEHPRGIEIIGFRD